MLAISPSRSILSLFFAIVTLGCEDGKGGGKGDDGDLGDTDADGDGFTIGAGDCNDADATVHPDAEELCDGVDNNCDGTTDEGISTTFFADGDRDGFGDTGVSTDACEAPDGYVPVDGDCDDDDPEVNPGAEEVCDGVDNNCDGDIDEGSTGTPETWYADDDGDGWGDDDDSVVSCEAVPGHVTDGGDCDDTDAAVHPGAEEVCDEIDNDCDGTIDGADATDAAEGATDADGDGFGEPGTRAVQCWGVDNELDCDDTNPAEPHVVDINSTASAPDGTMAAPWVSIQAGIDAADQCVVVFPGTYVENIDFSGKGIAVASVAGDLATVIDGGQNGPVARFMSGESSDSVLTGFTLVNGSGFEETATETVTDDSGNFDHYRYYITNCGGGVYVNGASPTLHRLTVADNLLVAREDSVDGSGNEYFYFTWGGGLCFRDTTLEVSGVNVITNDAEEGGAAYLASDADVTFTQAVVAANTADSGGAFEVDGGTLRLVNVASAWNEATAEGGGAMVIDGSLTAVNATFGADDAPNGGGIFLATDATGSTGVLTNSIVYGAATGEGVLVGSGGSLTVGYSDVYGNAGGEYSGVTDPTGSDGNLSANPKFTAVSRDGDWTNDDWTLGTGSPCIDAGDSSSSFNDADGTRNDMGAFGGPASDWNL